MAVADAADLFRCRAFGMGVETALVDEVAEFTVLCLDLQDQWLMVPMPDLILYCKARHCCRGLALGCRGLALGCRGLALGCRGALGCLESRRI